MQGSPGFPSDGVPVGKQVSKSVDFDRCSALQGSGFADAAMMLR